MIFEFNRKKRLKNQPQPADAAPEEVALTAAKVEFSDDDDDIHGVELSEYVRKHDVEEAEIWRKIKRGELVARTENGFVYVYGHHVPQPGFPSYFEENDALLGSSLPQMLASSGLPALTEQDHTSSALVPQLALLVDQLARAKEEHRSLLAFTQESMNRVTKMCESALASKDQVLEERESLIKCQSDQIQLLNAHLADEQQKLIKARQDMEDLQMLTQAIISDK